jgi:murein DD-endopeptidase MepM/ murein hydrolase activator NlpD
LPSKIMSKNIRAIAIVVALLLMASYFMPSSFIIKADDLSDMQKKYDSLETQQKQVLQQIEQNKSSKTSAQNQINSLDQNISLVTEQVDLLNAQISALNAQTLQKEQELSDKQKNIVDNTTLLKDRLCAIYETGEISYIAVLLSSDNLPSFLNRIELLQTITEHDNKLLSQMKIDKQVIESDKKSIEVSRSAVKISQNNLVGKQNDLAHQKDERSKYINQTNANINNLESQNAEINKQLAATDALIKKTIKERQSKAAYVGGDFLWPVQNMSTHISSPFGPRIHPVTHLPSFHSGIDIAGGDIYGHPILAANAGKIIAMVTGDYYYGKYIVIDHGGGISTFYGHEYAFGAGLKVGQTVSRGQTIAYVGSEGAYTTGPHLHFGVLLKGEYVNPLNYSYGNRK